eukprot:381947_1
MYLRHELKNEETEDIINRLLIPNVNSIDKNETVYLSNEIANYSKKDIKCAIDNFNHRVSWNIGSKCLIYSRSHKYWHNGEIANIFVDSNSNQEWLVVKYNQTKKKKIQRFSPDIKPLKYIYQSNDSINTKKTNDIVNYLKNKSKQIHQQQTERFSIVSRPENKTLNPKCDSDTHTIKHIHSIDKQSSDNEAESDSSDWTISSDSSDSSNDSSDDIETERKEHWKYINRQITKHQEIISLFQPHLSMDEANKLQCGDMIDHKYSITDKFDSAMILGKKGTNLKIHYTQFDDEYDKYSDYTKELHCFAAPGSISTRHAHRLKQLQKGDFVSINPIHKHPECKCGMVEELDTGSGQLQIKYRFDNNFYSYWTHCDNEIEIKARQYELKDILENHFYDGFINAERDSFKQIKQKIKKSMDCIKTLILPKLKSQKAVTEYIYHMHHLFFEQFICIKLKGVLNNIKWHQLINEFNHQYHRMVNDLIVNKDANQLQIVPSLMTVNSDRLLCQLSRKSWTMFDQQIIMAARMKLHTINDIEYKNDRGHSKYNTYDEFIPFYGVANNDFGCIDEPKECVNLQRVNFLLQIFQQHWIDCLKQNIKQLTFIDIFDALCDDDKSTGAGNDYDSIQLINDFEHIQQNHLVEISKLSDPPIFTCGHGDKCICNDRYSETEQDDEKHGNKYFNFTDPRHVNIMKYMVKVHMFLAHKIGLKIDDSENKIGIKKIKNDNYRKMIIFGVDRDGTKFTLFKNVLLKNNGGRIVCNRR